LPSTQAQVLSPPRVDVHCHLFNAEDIPLQGFVKKALENYPLGLILFEFMADNLISETPDFVEENEELNQLLGTGGLDCSSVLPIPFTLGVPILPVTEWLNLLKQSRFEIACELVNTYPTVNLFTPAILDYDHWLPDNEKARTTIAEQIILYEKIVRLFGGKIHPLVAFNPLKEVHYKEDIPEYQSLKWVKEAVEERGFIGVKLYPPTGFYPINNAGRILPTDPFYEYRVKIDEALENLYEWCIAEDVSIMTHCAEDNGLQGGYGDRANPDYWEEVLQQYPELRLNLAHFGRDEEVIMANGGGGWAWKIAELMDNYPNVYADTGYHEVVLPGPLSSRILRIMDRAEYVDGLDKLFNDFTKVWERLMYGSDMHVLIVQNFHKIYLIRFKNIFDDNWPDLKDDFLGQNALRFFGLDDPGTKNRQRLLEFYEKHNMVEPQWWVGSWLPQPPPSTPENLQATAASPSKIILCWDASSDNVGVKGYKIYRDGIEIDTTTDTIFQDMGLSASTTYVYTVSAYDSADRESPQSSPPTQATTL
jgi:predicted TIM-barrel fold metal-dependent hydrolase